MMTDGSNIFPTPGSNVFPSLTIQAPVQASVYSSQIISNGASFSGSGWGRLALHIIGGGGGGGSGVGTSVSINQAFLGLIIYTTITGASGGNGASYSGSDGGNGGSVSQSPYYTYRTSNNAFATSVDVTGGNGGTKSSACTAGSNAGYYGAGGGGGGGGYADYPGCNGGAGGPGAVFIGIISEHTTVTITTP
jgi:hypothetical protein